MKKWFFLAIFNMVLALVFVVCLNITIISTPDSPDKSVETEKATVTYYNEGPKTEVKNQGTKNELKPTGQVQKFEVGDPNAVPEIKDSGPEK